jgi:hypothetical protein
MEMFNGADAGAHGGLRMLNTYTVIVINSSKLAYWLIGIIDPIGRFQWGLEVERGERQGEQR